MSLWSRLIELVSGWSPSGTEPPSRHARRAAGRQRHHESGEPLWTPDDQLPSPANKREVADVTPGTPGHYGSVRTIEDD